MLLYTDAGVNNAFKYFVYSDACGKVIGYKLGIAKQKEAVPELEAIIAALYWLSLRKGKHVVLTDYKPAVDVINNNHKPKAGALVHMRSIGKGLLTTANAILTWIPRELNVAGKILDAMPKGAASRDAGTILNYLNELR